MRYLKVLILVILFFLIMTFFVQNQEAFSQASALKLDLLFCSPIESSPLPFYSLLIISFVLGALCVLIMLMWDRLSLSARLGSTKMKVNSLEKELAKARKENEEAQKQVEEAQALAKKLGEELEAKKAIGTVSFD